MNYTEKEKLFMKYILALDIGIASVGWAVLDKESDAHAECACEYNALKH